MKQYERIVLFAVAGIFIFLLFRFAFSGFAVYEPDYWDRFMQTFRGFLMWELLRGQFGLDLVASVPLWRQHCCGSIWQKL